MKTIAERLAAARAAGVKSGDFAAAVYTEASTVDLAIRDLLIDNSEIFYGQLLSQFRRITVTNKDAGKHRYYVPTAAVGVEKNQVILIINQDFFDKECSCDEPEFPEYKEDTPEFARGMRFCKKCGFLETGLTRQNRCAVLKHECQHIAHRHVTRPDAQDYNPKAANIAQDAAINQLNDGLPKGCIDYRAIEGAKAMDMWIHYYELLMKKQEEEGDNEGECQTCGGSGSVPGDGGEGGEENENGGGADGEENNGAGEEEGDGNGEGKDADGHGKSKNHNHGNHGKPCPDCQGGTAPGRYGVAVDDHKFFGEEDEETNMNIADELLKGQIKKAAQSVGIGNVPAHIREEIANFDNEAKVDWRKVLRNWMTESFKKDRRLDARRESLTVSGVFPGQSYIKLPSFDVYVDASGSIGQDEFVMFMTECIAIAESLKAEVSIHQWDTQVHHSEVLDTRIPELVRHACGGTDCGCVIEHAWENKNRNIIIMTDGYFHPVDPTGLNVLWVYTPNHDSHGGKEIVLED